MIKRTSLVAAAIAAGMLVAPQAISAAELKIASFPGPKHPVNARMLAPWVDKVNATSSGLTAKLFVAGKLGKGPAKQFKRALDGVADMSFGLQGYTSKQFRATTLIELANVMTSAQDGTNRLNAAYQQSAAVRKEYDKVKVLAIWTIDTPIIMTKNKPIKSVADLKGLKLRTPSQMSARAIKALGAVPVPMPITKLYNALARGTVDGVSGVANGVAHLQDQGSHPLLRGRHSVRIVADVRGDEQEDLEQAVAGAQGHRQQDRGQALGHRGRQDLRHRACQGHGVPCRLQVSQSDPPFPTRKSARHRVC